VLPRWAHTLRRSRRKDESPLIVTSIAADRVDARSATEQLGLPALLALFLVPGALMTLAFVVLAPIVESAGFPPLAALLLAILLVLIPIELGIVLRAGRGHDQRIWSVVPYRRPLPLRDWAWLVPVLVVLAFVGFGVSMAVESAVIDALFGWLPEWFVRPVDADTVSDFSREAWLVTLAAFLVLNGVLGPVVEELYFRGYLLPRMEWMGRWAPLVNVSLFSLYQLLVAMADRRPDLRLWPDRLRGALERERVPRHGRPLHAQHPERHHRGGPGPRPPLTP
jgi:uncharacterized protein